MKSRILCIGDIVVDIIPSPFPIQKDIILSDGETFVDKISMQRGGNTAIFACTIKMLIPNAEVRLVSRVGTYPHGKFLEKEIRRYGVIPEFILDSTTPTQMTVAITYQDGERHYLTYLGALQQFSIQDLPSQIFQNVDHLAVRGIWFVPKILAQSQLLFRQFVERGIPISVDIGFDPFWHQSQFVTQKEFVSERKQALFNALQYVTYLFGNEQEFMHLCDIGTLDDAIVRILEYRVKYIIIHRGSHGSLIVMPDFTHSPPSYKKIEIPAIPVEKIVNPVGTGDIYDGIFLSQIFAKKSIEYAAAFASAGAALSLQSTPGEKITIKAINAFLQQHLALFPFLSITKNQIE